MPEATFLFSMLQLGTGLRLRSETRQHMGVGGFTGKTTLGESHDLSDLSYNIP